MRNNIFFRYFSKNSGKYLNIPKCINCKHFIPNDYAPKDLMFGICKKFRIIDKFYSIAMYYPAKICRDSEKLCGENARLYIKK